MNVLCALGARDSAALIERLLEYVPHAGLELLLLFVIDEGPRHDLARLRGPLHRGPRLNPERRTQMDEAELRQSDASLAEARAVAERMPGITATTRRMHGNPERTIVEVASADNVDLVVVGAREGLREQLLPGPHSVGHVARYVLDHAPCDVLLIRS
jgi:nucleotide-binding universal stress UspA family protein